MKGVIVGKEVRSYKDKEGVEKTSRNLYVFVEKSPRAEEGMEGNKVETVFVSFDISDIHVGDYVEFVYEVTNTSRGTFARLVDVIKLGSAKVTVAFDK